MGNPSREAILARIREGLRTPAPPLEERIFSGPIFEPVENPLERFQQECRANLMECRLTAGAAASAQALAGVLQSLSDGEVFVRPVGVGEGFARADLSRRELRGPAVSPRQIRWWSQGGRAESPQATVTLA